MDHADVVVGATGITPKVWDIAKNLFGITWRHYMMQLESITRDDYARMKEVIGYRETYEEHMKRLVEGIPNDTRTTVTQIAHFITKYCEFQDPKYAAKFESVIEHVERNREQHKRKALEILLKMQNKNTDNGDDDADEMDQMDQMDHHPPLFELSIGANEKIVLPTFGNPMMTALYSIMFQCFAFFQQTEDV